MTWFDSVKFLVFLCLCKARLAGEGIFLTYSFVHAPIHLAVEHNALNMNEPILLPIGTSGLHKTFNFGVQEVKVKVTQRQILRYHS